jgi:hypothetical protein
MENRIFFCKRNGKEVKVIIDPTGVMLSPLYQDGIVCKKSDEQKQHLIDMMKQDEELGLYGEVHSKQGMALTSDYIQNIGKEIKVDDIFNDEKRENIKKFIDEIKNPSEPNQALKDAAERFYEDTYTNKEIRTWWLNQTEERRRNMVREYFKGGNSENINTLYGIMPEEMEEMYNINVDVVIMDWEEILFDFIDFYPCQLPDELFEWLKENYEIPKKKDAKHIYNRRD